MSSDKHVKLLFIGEPHDPQRFLGDGYTNTFNTSSQNIVNNGLNQLLTFMVVSYINCFLINDSLFILASC